MAKEEPLATEPGGLFPRLQQRYGLGRDPLAMDQPFFGGAQRQHGLDTLCHLAGFGDMALLVTGERGCGKTRMLAELVRSESDKLSFHRLQPQELTSEQALATRLMTIAHKTLGNGQSARDAVFGFFKWSEAATRKGRRLVLLLDDADHVPAAILRILLAGHRNADTAHCAVPVLSGAEQILDLIGGVDAADLSQAPIHQIPLRPLNPDELADYLSPRLAQAGGDASQLLSRLRIQQLHTMSQGSLGRLKRIAPAVWLDLAGAAPQRQRGQRKGKTISKQQILWPVFAVALLGASWVLVSWQYDETSSGKDMNSALESEQPPVVERKIIRLGPGQDANGTVTTESASTARDSAVNDSIPTGLIAANPPTSESGQPDPARKTAPAGESHHAGNPQLSPTNTANPDNRLTSDSAEKSAESSVRPDTVSGAESGAIEKSESSVQADSGDSQKTSDNPEPDDKPASEQTSRQDVTAKDSFQSARPDRFVSLSDVKKRSGFTAQYVAGYEEETATSVLDQYPNVEGLIYTRSLHQGKPWYVVFYGQFASRDEASQILQSRSGTLDGLARRDRWVRSYGGF